MLGVVGAEIWTCSEQRTPEHHGRAFEEKESSRWLTGAKIAATRLAEAAQVISVSDRQSDIYPLFARRPDTIDLIIRAAQDRKSQQRRQLVPGPVAWDTLAVMEVRIAPRGPGDKGRVAKVALPPPASFSWSTLVTAVRVPRPTSLMGSSSNRRCSWCVARGQD